MNFIDWHNEYDNICDFDSDEESDKELPDNQSNEIYLKFLFPALFLNFCEGCSPIPGMNLETFNRLIVENYFLLTLFLIPYPRVKNLKKKILMT